jgi:hypothetical protein
MVKYNLQKKPPPLYVIQGLFPARVKDPGICNLLRLHIASGLKARKKATFATKPQPITQQPLTKPTRNACSCHARRHHPRELANVM